MSSTDDLLAALGVGGAVGAYGLAKKVGSKFGKTPGRAHFVELNEDRNDLEPEEAGDVNDLPDCA